MTIVTVLAFDPGGTTGWSSYKATRMIDPDGNVEWYDELHTCGSLGPKEHHKALETLIELSRTEVFHLVSESFEFRQGKQRTGLNLMSREYIGVMKNWCQSNDQQLHLQTAAMGKGFVDDRKLKIMDLWCTNKHSRDARRHLIFYMVNKMQRHDMIQSWRNL